MTIFKNNKAAAHYESILNHGLIIVGNPLVIFASTTGKHSNLKPEITDFSDFRILDNRTRTLVKNKGLT